MAQVVNAEICNTDIFERNSESGTDGDLLPPVLMRKHPGRIRAKRRPEPCEVEQCCPRFRIQRYGTPPPCLGVLLAQMDKVRLQIVSSPLQLQQFTATATCVQCQTDKIGQMRRSFCPCSFSHSSHSFLLKHRVIVVRQTTVCRTT